MRSTTLARFERDASCSINARVTAAVDNRSSQKRKGRSVSAAKLRTKARVDCARAPSLPSILSGRPTTKAATLNSSARASKCAASAENLPRFSVSRGVARRRSTSDKASPIVLVPRSMPINRCDRLRRAARSRMSDGPQFIMKPRAMGFDALRPLPTSCPDGAFSAWFLGRGRHA